MENELLTLKEFGKNWWWKQNDILQKLIWEVNWPVVEEAARNYELMRRSPKGKKFAQAYWQLCREGKTIVHTLWVNWPKWTHRFAANRSQYQEIGWTPVYENQHRQWNLRLADKKLIDEFIREIRLLREIQKIPTPRRNKGEKHRGVSWKLIEFLDRKQNGIGKFSASERHTIAEAKRRAEKYFVEYECALEDWKNNPNPAFIIEEHDNSDGEDRQE
jgi:hypothetical protein